jgi:serpin B
MRRLGSLILVLWFCSGCGGGRPAEIAASAQRPMIRPAAAPEELRSLVRDNSDFAFLLFRQLGKDNQNLVFSPFAVSISLAMIYGGANGGTEGEIAHTLHFSLPRERLPAAFHDLDRSLLRQGEKGSEEKFRLLLADAVWCQQGGFFQPRFLDDLAKYYNADIKLVNFSEAPEISRQTINSWMRQETGGRLEELLPAGAVTGASRLVLTEAACFRGQWILSFPPGDTHPGAFTLAGGEQVAAPVMVQTNPLKYAQGKDYQAVELPYEMGRFSLLLLLPREGEFASFRKTLNGRRLEEIVAGLGTANEIRLSLPKFDFASCLRLKTELSDLGLIGSFGLKADFSGISDKGNLFLDEVFHKAYIQVDEAGTEAAASPAGVLETTAPPGEPVAMEVNRPFVFLIRDIETGSIIFLGQVLDPRG